MNNDLLHKWKHDFARYFIPRGLDYDGKRLANLTLCFSLIMAGISASYSLVYLEVFGSKILFSTTLVGALLFMFAPITMKISRSIVSTHFYLTLVGLGILITIAFLTGGHQSTLVNWFILVPPIAVHLLGKQKGLIISAFLVSTLTFFYFIDVGQYIPSEIPQDSRAQLYFISIFGAIIASTLFSLNSKRSMDEAYELVKEKHQQNNELLQILSHDVATPLSVVKTHSSIVLNKMENGQEESWEKQKLRWANIHNSVTSLAEVLEHVREIRALDSGKKKVPLTKVNLLDIVKQSQDLFSQRLEEKNINLVYDESVLSKIHVWAEPNSLKNHVLNNILSNAIKFSFPNKTIHLEVNATGKNFTLSVIDSGIGIPDNILKNLFRTDVPTSRRGTNNEKGSGFGMNLVNSYMSHFGGRIHVTSSAIEENKDQHGTKVDLVFVSVAA